MELHPTSRSTSWAKDRPRQHGNHDGCCGPIFRLPKDHDDALDALREAWIRSQRERVEIACDGGHGRTGTALACIAVLDGVSADKAVKFVRERYNPRAVETPWQRRYVAHFTAD
ncbi:protein phosphatase [Arthrobacter sp. BF1]|uniref:protein-tyrosine phosphatase family protein n=1 Tax=Arthrobacter sp. BF1 TaxID=2821145 RepID=UPI00358EEE1A